jgi:hypothetical protein
MSKRAAWLILAVLAAGIVAALAYNDVSSAVTPDDQVYAKRILRDTGHGNLVGQKRPSDFDDQVRTVLGVQDAVLSIAPENVGIPLNHPRELSDLYRARSGLCYDRSRAIEKILADLGFEVRHAAIYATKDTGSALEALLTPRTPSHAVTEVKTARGWMLIDSNSRWIGLTRDGKPVDLAELQEGDTSQMTWDPRLKGHMNPIFEAPFSYLFGLYSRHGRFYPPYTPIPDADWRQIPYNVTG